MVERAAQLRALAARKGGKKRRKRKKSRTMMRRRRRRYTGVKEKGSRIRVQAEEEEEEEARRRICRPRTCHPVGFGGSWAFLVPWWKPNRGFEVQNPAGALRTPTPTVLSTHLEQGRNAHRDAQAKNALTSIPPLPPSNYTSPTPRPPTDLFTHPRFSF